MSPPPVIQVSCDSDNNRGRFVVAAKSIQANTVVFKAIPYGSTICEVWRTEVCWNCRRFEYGKYCKIKCSKLSNVSGSSKKATKGCRMCFCSIECFNEKHTQLLCDSLVSFENELLKNSKSRNQKFRKDENSEILPDSRDGYNDTIEKQIEYYWSAPFLDQIRKSPDFKVHEPDEYDREILRLVIDILCTRVKEAKCSRPSNDPVLLAASAHQEQFPLLANLQTPTFKDVLLMQNNEWLYFEQQWKRQYGVLENPVSHSEVLPLNFRRHIYNYLILRSCLTEEVLGPDPSLFRGVVFREMANSFGIWDNEGELLGFEVIPLATYFNHSCAPNLRRTMIVSSSNNSECSHRAYVEFKTVCDVVEGEELNISYGDVTDCLDVRQNRLIDKYFFECRCKRCMSESKL